MRATELPRVAILVDTSTGWGRRLIHGIHMYVQKHGPWHLWVEPRGQHEHLRPPPGWSGEGVIARVSTPAMARELSRLRVPVVNISSIQLKGKVRFPRVSTDLAAAGKLAAEHFLNAGFEHFAYFGLLRLNYVAEHFEGFSSMLAERGQTCQVYRPAGTRNDWKNRQAHLGEWLKKLPKPVAILTWARGGLMILDACRWAELDVPGEVAVLEGDEDELLNGLVSPPMSGIAVPSEEIGHESAALLDRLMAGGAAPDEPILLPPSHVVVRQSTDTLAIDEPELAEAIRFIRAHACDPISVDDVLRAIPISRRSLERRFAQVLGRSPAEEMRRVRLERAKQLLVDSDLPIPQVARMAGFGTPEYLSYAFRTSTNQTPLKYRSRIRAMRSSRFESPYTDTVDSPAGSSKH